MKLLFTILLVLAIYYEKSYAQYKMLVDSLKTQYANCTDDKTKILLLAELTKASYDPYYAIKGFYWSKLLKYQKGINRNSLKIIENYHNNYYVEDNSVYIRKVTKILTSSLKIKDTVGAMQCYLLLGQKIGLKDTIKANRYYQYGFKLANQNSNLYLALFYKELALLEHRDRPQKALVYYNLSNNICLSINNLEYKIILSDTYYWQYFLYLYRIHDLQNALKYLLKRIKLEKELGQEKYAQDYDQQIVYLYDETNDYYNSIKYLKQVIQSEKDTNSYYYYGYLSDLGQLYFMIQEYSQAEKITKKALEYFKVRCNNIEKYLSYRECTELLSLIYFNTNKSDEAIKILTDFKNDSISLYYSKTKLHFSHVFFYIDELIDSKKEALINSNKIAIYSSKDSIDLEQKNLLLSIYFTLYKNYKIVKNKSRSLQYLDKYISLKEGMFNKISGNDLTNMISNYEQEIKNNEINLITKDKKIALQKNRIQFIWTITLLICLLFLVITAILLIRNIRFQKSTNKLLNIQHEEIKDKNEELSQLNDEISAQRDLVVGQRDLISRQKQDITESIQYAYKIQTAAIPNHEILKEILKEYFILYIPRDIVSGDFYWIGKFENKIIILAADCTGHGVPGAFMSMLGIAFLNEIVNKQKVWSPNLILDELRKKIVEVLQQEGEETNSRDGMDIAAVTIDIDNNKLLFAGANNPLYLLKNNDIIQTKGDRMPVGIYMEMKPFSLHTYELAENDIIYIFSDGFPDQFGGENGRKYMYNRFREFIFGIHKLSLNDQKGKLQNEFMNWKGNLPQVDDVLIVGIKV